MYTYVPNLWCHVPRLTFSSAAASLSRPLSRAAVDGGQGSVASESVRVRVPLFATRKARRCSTDYLPSLPRIKQV